MAPTPAKPPNPNAPQNRIVVDASGTVTLNAGNVVVQSSGAGVPAVPTAPAPASVPIAPPTTRPAAVPPGPPAAAPAPPAQPAAAPAPPSSPLTPTATPRPGTPAPSLVQQIVQSLGGSLGGTLGNVLKLVGGPLASLMGGGQAQAARSPAGATAAPSAGSTSAPPVKLPMPAAAPPMPPVGAAGGAAGAAGGAAGAAGGAGAAAGAAAGGPAALIMAGVANTKEGWGKAASKPSDGANVASGMLQAGMGPIFGPIAGKIVDTVAGAVGDVMRAPGAIAEKASQVGSTAMSGDNRGAMKATYEGFVDMARQVPIVGEALGILGDTVGKVTGAVFQFADAAVARGKELSGYDAGLATSNAMADVTKLIGDIQEAQELGPELARITDAQSRMDNTFREIWLPIKKWALGKFAPLMEGLADFVKGAHEKIVTIATVLDYVWKALEFALSGDLKTAGVHLSGIERAVNAALALLRVQKDPDYPWDKFFDELLKANPMPGFAPAAPPAPGVIPALRGLGI